MLRLVSRAGARELKEQLTDSQPDITVPERDQTSYKSNKTEFNDRVILDELVLPEGRSPKSASFDEESAVNTATDTKKDEGDKFENVPVSNISDLKKHDFVGSIWVQKFQR